MSRHDAHAQPVELTVMGGQSAEPSGVRLAVTLALAGALAGLLLASAYEMTRPVILANKQRALQRAVFEVVPGSTSLVPLVEQDGALRTSESLSGAELLAAYAADGTFRGYALVGAGPGFQDTIRLIFGYDPARQRITGMYVLDSRETPGLGDKIYKDPKFVSNFADLSTEPSVALVKGERSAENQVDAITGATISSRAVVGIVNRTLEHVRPLLPEKPPAPPAEATHD